MSFDIPIRVDSAAVEAGIKRVTGELDRMERASKAATDAVQRGLADGTIRADQEAEAFKKITRELANIERAAEKAANASSGLQAQMQSRFSQLGAQLEAVHGALGSLTTLAGAAGIAMGLQSAVHAAMELGDAYTSLGNRIQQVSRNQEEQGYLMERTRQIANASRAEWNATGELFVRLTNATKEMGLSQGHVLRLTETISKAFAQSGASSSEAAAGMLQLSQALASGKLQGDEFRSLAEAMPSLLDLFAQKLGVTRGALKQLGADGKITADVIVAAFDDAGTTIDQGFAKSVPTLSQSFTVFKNQMEATFGPLLQTLLPKLGEYLSGIADRITGIVNLIERAASQLDKIPGGRSAVGKAYDWGRTVFDPVQQARKVADYSDESGAELIKAQVEPELWAKYADQFSTLNEQIGAMTAEFGKLNPPTETFSEWMNRIAETTHDLPKEIERTNDVWNSSVDVTSKITDVLGLISTKFDDTLLAFTGVDKLILPGLDAWLGKVLDLDKAHDALATGATTAIGRYSVMLGNFITGFAADLKASDSWDNRLDNFAKRATATHQKLHDSWKDTFVSPTLVGIDQIIARLKEMVEVQTEAANGLKRMGISGESKSATLRGLAGRGFSDADTSAEDLAASANKRFADEQRADRDAGLTAIKTHALADYRKQLEETEKMWEKIGQTIQGVGDKFVDFMVDGKQSFSDFTRSVLKDLTKIILKELIAAAIKAYIGGGGGGFSSFYHTGATQGFTGQYGGPGVNPLTGLEIPHGAEGGSWMIRNGPTVGDRNLFGVLVNAGERVDVLTRDQQQGAANSNGARHVTIQMNDMDEARFEDLWIRVARRNPAAIRAAVTGR